MGTINTNQPFSDISISFFPFPSDLAPHPFPHLLCHLPPPPSPQSWNYLSPLRSSTSLPRLSHQPSNQPFSDISISFFPFPSDLAPHPFPHLLRHLPPPPSPQSWNNLPPLRFSTSVRNLYIQEAKVSPILLPIQIISKILNQEANYVLENTVRINSMKKVRTNFDLFVWGLFIGYVATSVSSN